MVEKKLEEMSILELKGVLFDLQEQIIQIQKYANETIAPLIKKKSNEEEANKKTEIVQ